MSLLENPTCLLQVDTVKLCLITVLITDAAVFQEAKMLVARAYRHTEKLLLDNRDKLTLVSRSLPVLFKKKTCHFIVGICFKCNL